MAEEDLDLTNTCPLCASPKVSTNRKGQRICRDCGNIAPAGEVVEGGIYSKIKGIFKVKRKKKIKKSKKDKKTKKRFKKRVKGRKRAIIKKKIKSILKRKKKISKRKMPSKNTKRKEKK